VNIQNRIFSIKQKTNNVLFMMIMQKQKIPTCSESLKVFFTSSRNLVILNLPD